MFRLMDDGTSEVFHVGRPEDVIVRGTCGTSLPGVLGQSEKYLPLRVDAKHFQLFSLTERRFVLEPIRCDMPVGWEVYGGFLYRSIEGYTRTEITDIATGERTDTCLGTIFEPEGCVELDTYDPVGRGGDMLSSYVCMREKDNISIVSKEMGRVMERMS